MTSRLRLQNQLLDGNARESARAVVSHFGAMQAQDYLGALWAVGARMKHVRESDIEDALARREIVRCWPMRGTLHFVAAEDVRWMLELLASRVLARHRAFLAREFGLDPKMLRRARAIVEKALAGGAQLTRAELYSAFHRGRVATEDNRGRHILFALAHERVICFGTRRGKQPTFVLLDEWLPASKPKPRDEAIAELARRYFQSHAPATMQDFAWWSGLTLKDIRNASVPLAEKAPSRRRLSLHLLPPFDEYTVAYKDRSSILDPAFAKKLNAGGGMINAVLVINGIVTGNWKRVMRGASVEITLSPFRALTATEQRALEREAGRYARFIRADAATLRFV